MIQTVGCFIAPIAAQKTTANYVMNGSIRVDMQMDRHTYVRFAVKILFKTVLRRQTMMKRNTRLDYRCYEVEPPHTHANRRNEWFGQALLKGMPNVTAPSEGELRRTIDYAHKCRPAEAEK